MFTRLLILLALALPASAATFNVNTTVDTQDATPGNGVCADSTGRCSLRAAITEANALTLKKHTINLPAGTYTQALAAANEDNNAGGDWDIKCNLTVYGAGPTATILRPAAPLSGLATERVLDIFGTGNSVSLWNLGIQRGRLTAQPGGGIRSVAALELFSSKISGNQSTNGGGIYSEGSLFLSSTEVSGNRCVSTSACSGGGIFAKIGAGQYFNSYGSVVKENEANSAGAQPGNGGGIAIHASNGSATVFNESAILANLGGGASSSGAGLNYLAVSGLSTLTTANNTRVSSNAFAVGASASLTGVGIAIRTTGSGQISGKLNDLHLFRNSVNTELSSLYTDGGNMAVSQEGGPIELTMVNSSVNLGRAYRGAGIALMNVTPFSPLRFSAQNVTFGFNETAHPSVTSPQQGTGGGVAVLGNVFGGQIIASFDFCTFSQNFSGQGDAIAQYNASVYLKNSVIAGNANLTGQVYGSVISQNYNHFENISPTQVTLQNNDTIGTSGLQPALTDNRYFLPASPGILLNMIPNGASGCGSTVTTDQRGLARPQNGACEKGAIELP